MIDIEAVKIGDVFKCRRRGHLVVVADFCRNAFSERFAFYKNNRGRRVRVPVSRLVNKARFELLPVEAPAAAAQPA